MNPKATLSSIAVGCCLAATAFTGTAEAHGSFTGSWTALDGDGSNMTLKVQGGGGHYAVRYFDDAATQACQGAPASVNGAGVSDGDQLWMRGPLVCMPGGNLLRDRITLSFTYSATLDTLTDNFGITWTRAG